MDRSNLSEAVRQQVLGPVAKRLVPNGLAFRRALLYSGTYRIFTK